MPREIITRWTTLAGGSFVTVMHFVPANSVATQRAAIRTWLLSALAACASTTSATVATEGRDLSDTTGEVVGFWNDGTAQTASGTITGQAPDAAQGLVRWRTSTVVNGRRLQGRTFIPGIGASAVSAGNLSSSAQASLIGGTTALLDPVAVGFQIWHRPVNGAGGQVSIVTERSAWSELAVQRGRRN